MTERELMRTMLDSLQGKTLIWVTHHLIGAEKMDEIVFVENGKIVMQGSHEQLLAREERYRLPLSWTAPVGLSGSMRHRCHLRLPNSRPEGHVRHWMQDKSRRGTVEVQELFSGIDSRELILCNFM